MSFFRDLGVENTPTIFSRRRVAMPFFYKQKSNFDISVLRCNERIKKKESKPFLSVSETLTCNRHDLMQQAIYVHFHRIYIFVIAIANTVS